MRLPKFSPQLLLIAGLYFLLTILLKWRLHPNWLIFLYGAGGGAGLMIFDLLEQFIAPTVGVGSPLRSVLVQLIIVILSLFVITSTGSVLGAGLVLFLQLRILDLQVGDLSKQRSLASWSVSNNKQIATWYLLGLIAVLVAETLLFVLAL